MTNTDMKYGVMIGDQTAKLQGTSDFFYKFRIFCGDPNIAKYNADGKMDVGCR